MARATLKTWLPLDRWAQILGINPWHFNGVHHTSCGSSSCTGIWYQHPWQSNKLSREDVALAIHMAELMLADFVGYNLLPDWGQADILPPRYHNPNYRSNVAVADRYKSVKLPKGYLLAGGVKTCVEIDAEIAIDYQDQDGDGFDERGRITVDTTYDLDTIKIYHEGYGGDDAYEIRPVKVITATNPYVFEIPAWQLVRPVYSDQFCADDDNQYTEDIYETNVAVHACYNDATTNPVTLVYQPESTCQDCDLVSYTDCLIVQDSINGYGIYNKTLREDPDRLIIDYYSGYRDLTRTRPYVEMDPYWEFSVAALSVGLLDRDVHCCGGNQCAIASRWASPMNIADGSRKSNTARYNQYLVTHIMLNNPLGIITEGSWFAYQRAFYRKLN